MSKAFDNVDLHLLINKLHKTNMNNTLIKFISNYVKGRKGYVIFDNVKSHKLNFKSGVPQGGVLSPTLFNIYMSDLPSPPLNVDLISYADDLNTLSSHSNIHIAEQNLQPYLDSIHKWTTDNKLELNPTKSTATLFTTDPAEYTAQLNLKINNTNIPTVKHPKVLGLTLDPKLNFAKHIEITKDKASKTINLLKSLSATSWGKQKETLLTTYKTITRPVIEYANTV
jgi:retron-type reverse transcriptase